MKEPTFWEAVANFLQTRTAGGVAMAFFMSVFRAYLLDKNESCVHTFLDALICGFLTVGILPILSHVGLNDDFSVFIGSAVGFVGAEKIRAFLLEFFALKIRK